MTEPEIIKPLRCLCGARVSTDEQAAHGTSLESQLQATTERARQMGGVVVGTCIEAGVSGALYQEREKLQGAIAQIERGEADALIYFDLTRLSRDVEYLTAILRRVEAAGGRVIFCDAEYAPSADGFLQRGIKGVLSHHERLKIHERMQSGKIARARQGVQTHRSLSPYGYRIVQKNDVIAERYPLGSEGKYVVVEPQATVAREIFARFGAGESLYKIAASLNLRGIETPQPYRRKQLKTQGWTALTLHSILKNEVYKGETIFGRYREIVSRTEAGEDGKIKKFYKKVEMPPEQWIVIPVPPLVEVALWEKCQVRRKENRARLGGRPDRKHMLTGLLRCPECGGSMGSIHAGSTYVYRSKQRVARGLSPLSTKAYACYRSRSVARNHPQCSYRNQFYLPQTDARVLAQIIEYVTQPQRLKNEITARQNVPDETAIAAEKAAIEKSLQQMKREEATLIEGQLRAIEAGISSTLYEQKLIEVLKRRANAEARLKKLQSIQSAFVPPHDVVAAIQGVIADVQDALLASPDIVTPAEKHDALAMVIRSIVPQPDGTFAITWMDEQNGA